MPNFGNIYECSVGIENSAVKDVDHLIGSAVIDMSGCHLNSFFDAFHMILQWFFVTLWIPRWVLI